MQESSATPITATGTPDTPPPAADSSAQPTRNGDLAPPTVSVRDLHKVYRSAGHDVHALRGVSLDIRRGSFTAIMGASGSGKSTLLHLLGGLAPPTSGTLLVEGRNLTQMSDGERTIFRRRRIGVIFQQYNLLPTLTARENVAMPMLIDGKPLEQFRTRVDELLTLVHLQHRLDHRPDALSGGEQQRVAIARALMNDPAIVLADEPTGNLDSKQAHEVWRLLQRIARENGRTIVMVTHEAHGAAFADEVIVVKDGQVVGTINAGGLGDAALVAAGYQKLAG
ncbi:MAG: ABC transporter ATP-binding protein [Phycisphaerae bacterium]|nr:ABC transporter ATP-binding protein [Phycisphaerae bacterium]